MDRRIALKDWIKIQHKGQLIKKTDEPYFNHLLTVAIMAGPAAALTYEIGLCHDLFEKTSASESALKSTLLASGYGQLETDHIINCTKELTNRFNKKDHPELSKKDRKSLEDTRLLNISTDAQTVKYADLMYNSDWMINYDREHSATYLIRKLALIEEMKKGDDQLRQRASAHLRGYLF